MRDLSYKMVFMANYVESSTQRFDQTDIREENEDEEGMENNR